MGRGSIFPLQEGRPHLRHSAPNGCLSEDQKSLANHLSATPRPPAFVWPLIRSGVQRIDVGYNLVSRARRSINEPLPISGPPSPDPQIFWMLPSEALDAALFLSPNPTAQLAQTWPRFSSRPQSRSCHSQNGIVGTLGSRYARCRSFEICCLSSWCCFSWMPDAGRRRFAVSEPQFATQEAFRPPTALCVPCCSHPAHIAAATNSFVFANR